MAPGCASAARARPAARVAGAVLRSGMECSSFCPSGFPSSPSPPPPHLLLLLLPHLLLILPPVPLLVVCGRFVILASEEDDSPTVNGGSASKQIRNMSVHLFLTYLVVRFEVIGPSSKQVVFIWFWKAQCLRFSP